MLRNVHFLNLDLPLNDFKTFDDFRGSDGIIQKDDLRKNFDKLLQLNKTSDKNREKHLRQFDNCLKANNISSLEKLLMENLLKYVEDMYHRKFKIKIAATIGKQGDQGKSEN
ncbi:hypothetical protein H6769_02855 [Candidatus Peribacteria bacterium]|nr:hypothetical protein [Candidatus Peribacteria bacterium]